MLRLVIELLRLSTGKKINIPDVVRTCIGSRIISSYFAYCKETDYSPCGRSSLFEILRKCSANQRKCLSGRDNTTANGISFIEKLSQIAVRK